MRKISTIDFAPFSLSHKIYINNSLNCKMNVAEGAIRSGKTIDHCIIASMYLETCADKVHLASGSSAPNAKLNIGYCNGYGLECLFRGRCRWGKFKDNEALYINTKTGQKVVIFVGGGKSDSFKKILGNSYGLWIATEINEHYDCDDSRTSFIKVALGRQIASIEPKILWDLNPSDPHASIYKDYIDKYMGDKQNRYYCGDEYYKGGYQYRLFTINDNLSISNERRKEIECTYTPGTVWYRRDILGERAVAEGIIFRYFADNPEPYLFDENDLYKSNQPHIFKNLKQRFDHLIIGVDFGDSGSKYSWHCAGFHDGWINMRVLECGDMMKSNGIDADMLCREFIKFYRMILEKYGYVDWIFCDSASNTLINTLKTACRNEGLDNSVIMPVVKNELRDRPRLLDSLFCTSRLKINKTCKNTQKALSSLVWDEKKKDIPEDENKDNINDDYDSLCYTFITHTPYIELERS